ncbi:tRNA (adenine(22)-N(1))-methyltransferase [Peptostreptococcus faecalis]|uniref:tRNA (adenine(22)-N(1))-methyltransferase n=1 Tax=Peptostreptococcus faecalis TaxID=2045015 RepID=UPI000C7B56C0|nr:class I SAM-dependent methyltransferase [Peptostreptococcus faecalis]
MKLDERLGKIASIIEKEAIIADIGTDHAYLPVYLLEKEIIKRAIISDVNKGPLENAKKVILKNNLEYKVDFRLGNGVEVINVGEVDEIVIAGMGGALISKIIDNSIDICKSVSKMILQPMQSSEQLREYLNDSHFEIIDEHLVKEDFRLYEILEVQYIRDAEEDNQIDEIYYEIPKKLLDKKDKLLPELIERKIVECDKILKKIEYLKGEHVEEKRINIKNKKTRFTEILDSLEV